MRILIGYASAAGSTRGIAEHLATRLEGAGHVAVVESVDRVATIAGYDPVMLSSAIHNSQWLPDAAAAVTRLASALASLPVWALSASSIGATSSTVSPRLARSLHARTPLPKAVQQLAELTDLHGHRVFAGAVRRSDWAGLGSVIFRLMGGRYGDAWDWADITALADRVASGLARDQTLNRAATRHPLIEYPALLGAQQELGLGRRPLQG